MPEGGSRLRRAVTGARRYDVKHRIDVQGYWESERVAEATSPTFSPQPRIQCGAMYEFRVRAYGDGMTCAGGWGEPSDASSATTDACG